MTIHPQPVQYLPAYSATQIQAVSRLDVALLNLKAEGRIRDFSFGSWEENELTLHIFVAENDFLMEPLLKIQLELETNLVGLNIFIRPLWDIV